MPDAHDPSLLSASELAPRLRDGSLRVATLAEACLARIAAREARVHAWAFVDPQQVMAAAAALDRLGPHQRGLLHGLPFGIKDVFMTHDMPTQYNSPIYAGHRPGVDAACVASLRAAGALVVGKTETVEFAAIGRPPPTTNPHDETRTPGGSSSGSAAAVADHHVPLALGTQTGGSMIRPASFCGVYAFKPTFHLVSREGARSFSPSLDTIGWFARTAADLELVAAALLPASGRAQSSSPLRIGVYRSPSWPLAEPATLQAMERAEQACRAAGAIVRPLELPAAFDALVAAHGTVMRTEGGIAFAAEYRRAGGQLHANLRALVEGVNDAALLQLREALDLASHCRAEFDARAAAFDAILTPSVVGEAPTGLQGTGSYVFNAIWSLLHVPCVHLPCGTGPAGLPVGVTLAGARYSDRRVLAAARSLFA